MILLDDIFDKLDDLRVTALVKLLGRSDFGQVFITDARPKRVSEVCAELDIESRIFEIRNGSVVSEHTENANSIDDQEE